MSEENLTNKQPLIRYVNRQQMSWQAVDAERLISEEHPARAIWTLVGRLDLSPFYRAVESSVEEGGRPAFDPQLLISLWVYAYSQGIGSAREVARRCEYDPAFQWLTGLMEVNYHTLADFRVEKQEELDELFTQVLAALSKEGLITLEQVTQDGTKIKALASSRSYRHEGTIREHLEQARQQVAALGDPRNDECSPKVKQAQARSLASARQLSESVGPATPADRAAVGWPMGPGGTLPVASVRLLATTASCSAGPRSAPRPATGSSFACALAPCGAGATAVVVDPGSPSSAPKYWGNDLPAISRE